MKPAIMEYVHIVPRLQPWQDWRFFERCCRETDPDVLRAEVIDPETVCIWKLKGGK